MKVVLGSDHAGFALKSLLIPYLEKQGYATVDAGTYSAAPADYPDSAEAVALKVIGGEAGRGILICGSGIGASVAANKIPGARAGLCCDTYSAHQGVEHDNMNILVLGARTIGEELAKELCITYLKAAFSGEERHQRRLAKVAALEKKYSVRQ